MSDTSCLARWAISFVLLSVLAVPVLAQNRSTSGSDRLFLSFIEDATIIENQWWEGQIEIADSELVDVSLVRGIVALRPMERVEVGGRVGFGSTDTRTGLPDGSGATDLDVWGKYHFGTNRENVEFAAGGIVTVPTGDDTAGLGQDAFAAAGFGAMRIRFDAWILSVNLGLRVNGDGQTLGLAEADGKLSPSVGAGAIYPISDRLSIVGELDYEGERFEGADHDLRLLGGTNWRLQNRGMLRGALAVGLSDGAPDAQLLLSYAARF